MHDLRKKILLESGKTVSRKARSRPESAANSNVNSPAQSRVTSRANSQRGSDDEDNFNDSDDEGSLISSQIPSDDEWDSSPVAWEERLRDRIAEIVERKGSTTQGRFDSLRAYHHILRYHCAADQLQSQLGQLIPALLKSMRQGTGEEAEMAVKALAVTVISTESETIYGHVYSPLQTLCENSEEATVKANAMYGMSLAVVSHGGDMELDQCMEFFQAIVESDGYSIGAPDNAMVVTAALNSWGFVALHQDNLEVHTDAAIEAFSEQLDSTDVDVQVAAGNNIALILEMDREYKEDTGDSLVEFDVLSKLMKRAESLQREGARWISKKDRKQLHAAFKSIHTSMELGNVGPRYSTAIGEDENGHEYVYGHREKMRLGDIRIEINTWSLLHRAEMLKRVLGGGVGAHYKANDKVSSLFEDAHVEYTGRSGYGDSKKSPAGKSKSKGGRR